MAKTEAAGSWLYYVISQKVENSESIINQSLSLPLPFLFLSLPISWNARLNLGSHHSTPELYHLVVAFSFLYSPGPQPMEWYCPLKGESSHFSDLNLEMFLQTYLEICLHFNSIYFMLLFIYFKYTSTPLACMNVYHLMLRKSEGSQIPQNWSFQMTVSFHVDVHIGPVLLALRMQQHWVGWE